MLAPSRDSESVSVPMWHCRCTPRRPEMSPSRGRIEPHHLAEVGRIADELREGVPGRGGVRRCPLIPEGAIQRAVVGHGPDGRTPGPYPKGIFSRGGRRLFAGMGNHQGVRIVAPGIDCPRPPGRDSRG